MSITLTLRTLNSPYGDYTKGSILSSNELDSNFVNIKGELIYTGETTTNGITTTLILKKLNGDDINIELSGGTGNVLYTNSTPTTAKLGGIAQGTTFNLQTMQQMWDALLYPYQPPAFTNFLVNGISSTLEIGQTLTTPGSFTWSTSNSSNVATNSISINGYNIVTESGLENNNFRSINFTSTVTRTSSDSVGTRSWNIQAQNTSGQTFSTSTSIRWDYKMYVGTSSNITLTENQIEALSNFNSIKNGFAGVFNMSAGGYKYFCFANIYGTPSTWVDNSNQLNVAMNNVVDGYYTNTDSNGNVYALVSITNTYSQTTNYRIYRTKYQLGGSINIKIT
jgi:hypothetical protein